MHTMMVYDHGFMGDTIKLEHWLQQKSFQKGVRKFKMDITFGKNFVKPTFDPTSLHNTKIAEGFSASSHGGNVLYC